MRIHSLVGAAALLSASLAHADIVYSFQGSNAAGNNAIDFSFTEPSLLTTTTTIQAADLDVTVEPSATCSVSSFTITGPDSSSVELTISLSGTGAGYDCLSDGTNVLGPLNADGVYSNGAPIPQIVTITGSPALSTTPEPSSFALLGTGLLGVAGVVRKRFA